MKTLRIDCKKLLFRLRGVIDKSGTTIRFIKKEIFDYVNGKTHRDYGYLYLKDGKIIECERGYSNQYKGCEVLNIEKCWEENIELRMTNLFTGGYC